MSRTSMGFLLGVLAGLRTFTPPAAVSWAARSGRLRAKNQRFAFLGSAPAPWILSALALSELVGDKLPSTPSRKVPVGFAARIASGALCGAAVGGCAIAGALGAVAGTLAGYEFRTRTAKAIGGHDGPVAVLEDAIAVCGAAVILHTDSR
jgi:uncharacterized membrane protein